MPLNMERSRRPRARIKKNHPNHLWWCARLPVIEGYEIWPPRCLARVAPETQLADQGFPVFLRHFLSPACDGKTLTSLRTFDLAARAGWSPHRRPSCFQGIAANDNLKPTALNSSLHRAFEAYETNREHLPTSDRRAVLDAPSPRRRRKMAYAFAPSAPSLSWTTGTACARCPAIRLRHELPRNVRVSARPMQRSKTPQMGLIPFIPNWLALGAWFFGAYRFYLGFDSTSYQKVSVCAHACTETDGFKNPAF